jgi:hypothetical protein
MILLLIVGAFGIASTSSSWLLVLAPLLGGFFFLPSLNLGSKVRDCKVISREEMVYKTVAMVDIEEKK